MRVDQFDFELPEHLIALRPARPRDSARLLLVPAAGVFEDHVVRDAPTLFREGDLLVFNDTRVIPARLKGERVREDSIVPVETTLLKRVSPSRWAALAKPGKRLREGDRVRFFESTIPLPLEGGGAGEGVRSSNTTPFTSPHPLPPPPLGEGERRPPSNAVCLLGLLEATIVAKGEEGEITLAFDLAGPDLDAAIAAVGVMPLPPYIASKRAEDEQDRADYQTTYAKREGAVAAPTAGLHFSAELLARLDAAGVERTSITLHVGAGTFLPMKADDTDNHVMHAEWREIPETAAAAVNKARAEGRRVIAVGTTALRSLESAADENGVIHAQSGDTALFITPGYRFRVVQGLWTNFHLPRSTLFMLVAAFAGLDRIKAAYAHAVSQGYRFYSYGDACLIWLRQNDGERT